MGCKWGGGVGGWLLDQGVVVCFFSNEDFWIMELLIFLEDKVGGRNMEMGFLEVFKV